MRRLILAVAIGLMWTMGATESVVAQVDPSNPNVVMWRDQFGDPIDAYVEASPGDTIIAYMEINSNYGYWPGLTRIAHEMWWDTSVIVPSGPYQNYDYPGVDSPTESLGWAPDYHTANYPHYSLADLNWNGNGAYFYPYLRLVGWEIPIRADAPLGTTVIGGNVLAWQYGNLAWSESLSETNPMALHINVVSASAVPEPATIAMFSMGLAAFGFVGWRKRRRRV